MAAIYLIKHPSPFNFSRNPIVFGFKVVPYSIESVEARHKLRIMLEFGESMVSTAMSSIWEGSLTPDADGICRIDLASLLDSKLKFYVPNKTVGNKLHLCKEQCGYFRISFHLTDGMNLLTTVGYSDIYRVYKGGIAKKDIDNANTYLNGNIIVLGKPLHYFTPTEPIRHGEPKWIYFIMRNIADIESTVLNIDYLIADGSTENEVPLDRPGAPIPYQVYCVRVDTLAEDVLGDISYPDSLVQQEVTYIDNNANNIFEPVTMIFDHRPFYDISYLLFRNSLGGLDTQAVVGEKEISATIAAQTVETPQITELIGDFKVQSEYGDTYSTHTAPVKCSTGWITKQHLEKLRDLLLNKEVYIEYGNRLVPVYINTKSLSLYKSRDSLFSLNFEYVMAMVDENYSPDNLITFGDTCPSVEFFQCSQVYSGYVTVVWKLPEGYDTVEITVTVGSGSPSTTILIGNSGEKHIDANSASNTSIVTDSVYVTARVVCNEDTVPGSYGPITGQTLNILSLIPPIANLDMMDEGPRNTTARTLQLNGADANIIANDIATTNPGLPEFDNFYDIANAVTTASANGATLAWSAGKVIYTPTPTSIANTNQDFFFYKCKEIVPSYGTLNSALQMVIVPLAGEIPKVYIKMWALNQYQIKHKYGILNMCEGWEYRADIYLKFYSDAACTIPIDVTNFGITLNWDKIKIWQDYNTIGNPTTSGGPSVDSSGTWTCLGFSMLLYADIATTDFVGQTSTQYSWKITGGTGTFYFIPGLW